MVRALRADVAKRAGVAPSTVSNILNDRAKSLRIAPETVRRVKAAAAELGYVPQASARSLRGRASRTMGLMLGPLPPNVFVPILHDVVTAAIARSQERQYLVMPFADPGGEGEDITYVERVLADVDLAGVVSEMSPRNAIAGHRLHQMEVPVVWMSFGTPAMHPPGVGHATIRQTGGVEAVLGQLDLARNEEVAIVLGPGHKPERLGVALRMFDGFVHVVEAESWLADAGAKSMRQIRNELPRVRTIFCADDYLAFGVLHALNEDGLRVPDDYSVVGFGGFDNGAQISHRLTTVRWPVRELTIASQDALIDHVSGARPLQLQNTAPIIVELECEPLFGTTARLKD